MIVSVEQEPCKQKKKKTTCISTNVNTQRHASGRVKFDLGAVAFKVGQKDFLVFKHLHVIRPRYALWPEEGLFKGFPAAPPVG